MFHVFTENSPQKLLPKGKSGIFNRPLPCPRLQDLEKFRARALKEALWYEEICRKYKEICEKYEEICKKYEEICGSYEGFLHFSVIFSPHIALRLGEILREIWWNMRENGEICGKYEERCGKYEEIWEKYEEVCGNQGFLHMPSFFCHISS